MLVDLKLDVSQTQTLSLVVFQFVQGKRTECVVIEVSHDFPHTYLPNPFYSMNTSPCLNNKQAFPFVMIALHSAWDSFLHHLPLISTPALPFLVGHLISYLLKISYFFIYWFFLLPIMSLLFKLTVFILHPSSRI